VNGLRRSFAINDPIELSDAEDMSEFFDICKVRDIPIGEARMILVNEVAVGVFNVSGAFFAIDDACPHAGASLSHGIVDGDVVRCRIHHWRFCIRDGIYLDEMKPSCNVLTYPIRVVGDQVQIELDHTSLLNCNPRQAPKQL
jgi:nitrite reductase (NADH) small subunit/3-phenylpropionate/trans-cinnamate dioxygenase ferredoxin subunit